jgi:hypothetical protein
MNRDRGTSKRRNAEALQIRVNVCAQIQASSFDKLEGCGRSNDLRNGGNSEYRTISVYRTPGFKLGCAKATRDHNLAPAHKHEDRARDLPPRHFSGKEIINEGCAVGTSIGDVRRASCACMGVNP